jgi:hypothetical protein
MGKRIMKKHKEQYFTPKSLTTALFQNVKISGRVLEPCSGEGWITEVLENYDCQVTTNDIDEQFKTDYHMDISSEAFWEQMKEDHKSIDFVITNPPFSLAPIVMKKAIELAKVGVALLVRLSFLEPCEGRDKFLVSNPPSQIIVMPRISFTGDGKSDSVTCCWLVWYRDKRQVQDPIKVYLREWL